MVSSAAKYPHFNVVAGVSALLAMIVIYSVWSINSSFMMAVDAGKLHAAGYARAFSEHAESAFYNSDRLLLDVIQDLHEDGYLDGKLTFSQLQRILKTHAADAPQIVSMFIVDRKGNILADSSMDGHPELNVADREYFSYHKNNLGSGLFVSRPFKSRVTGKWRFSFSRPLLDRRGEFAGVVTILFNIEYFRNFYRSIPIGKEGRVVLVHRDSPVLVMEPFSEEGLKLDYSNSVLFREKLPKSNAGTFILEKGVVVKSPARIISYRALEQYPVIALVSFDRNELLTPWRSSAVKQALSTIILCVAVITLAILHLRQLRRVEDQQEELRKGEEKYRSLVDNLPVVTWKSDQDGHTVYISSNVEKIYGFTSEEILEKGEELWLGRIHEEDLPSVLHALEDLFNLNGRYDIEYRVCRKDGSWIWIHDYAYGTTREKGKNYAYGVFSDITARKEAEEQRDRLNVQLMQAQKMESVGQLAGGIAHDFNNLLTPVIGYADLLRGKSTADSDERAKLDGILGAAKRAKELTKQLLGFARKQVMSMAVIELNGALSSFNSILRRVVRESIDISMLLDPEPLHICADRTQLEHVILNLAVNAQDAIKGHGILTISTSRIHLDAGADGAVPGLQPGRYVVLAVSDTGSGIDSEHIDHIFEPFYTTKPAGHGTGLGLAMVYGIVKQHNGVISVKSAPGSGTCFTLYFPEVEGGAHCPISDEIPGEPLRSDSVRVLVVEDNELVRDMVVHILIAEGHHVTAAETSDQAIRLAFEADPPFELLVSDVIMPGMNGPAMYAEMLERLPHLRALFISGYSNDPVLMSAVDTESVLFLQKPFSVDDLVVKIAESLKPRS